VRPEKSWGVGSQSGKGENLSGKEDLLACKDLTWFRLLHSELSAKSKALQLEIVEDGKLDSKY